MSDQLTDGRRFRILAVVDDCTRECLALVADTSLSGAQVARELSNDLSESALAGFREIDATLDPVAGTLDGGSTSFSVGGNWSNSGTFTASTVVFWADDPRAAVAAIRAALRRMLDRHPRVQMKLPAAYAMNWPIPHHGRGVLLAEKKSAGIQEP